MRKKIFLLDAYALIFRGYYALIKNPRITSSGMDTSAILGFTNSLFDLLRRENPEYLGVIFDKGKSIARGEIFEAYKANRQATPDPIKEGMPYIYEILQAMHIPIIEKEGYEADDLIGTLAKQAEKKGYDVFMVTPDKDYAQLVSPHIFMYRPANRFSKNEVSIWGVPEVKEKFEVENPLQVIDYLAMMGDAVDNIPGLPGIGDKTARKFIKNYGSIEGLLENIHELKGKMKENIEANKELGKCSKQLATIMLDCPVNFEDYYFYVEKPNFEKIKPLFETLEFKRTLNTIQKIFGVEAKNESVEKPASKNPQQLNLFDAPTEKNKTVVTPFENSFLSQEVKTPLAEKLLLQTLLQQEKVALELVKKDPKNEHYDDFTAIDFYFQGVHYRLSLPENRAEKQVTLEKFKPFFESNIKKIGANFKAQIKTLFNVDISLNGLLWDIYLMEYLITADTARADLQLLMKKYDLPIPAENERTKTGMNLSYYLALQPLLKNDLIKMELENLYKDIELPLIFILAKMEYEGITIDKKTLQKLSDNISKEINKIEAEIFEQADTNNFNIASPKQLGEILFEKLKLVDKPKKTKTGQYATSEEVLKKIADKHPIVKNILQWRGLTKLQNTYVDALPTFMDKNGRIHTTYMQTVTTTGRLSSVSPNLQNIPIRTEKGRIIRESFVAKNENHILLAADYSQIELRLIAAMSESKTMIDAFKKGLDIHKTTAAKVFDTPIEKVTSSQRAKAKTINFGILYGQGARALSEQTKMSVSDAKKLIENYYNRYPELKTYANHQVDFVRENGYVKTLFGRKRALPYIHSQNGLLRSAAERNAVNTPIQGTAADIIKKAMIDTDSALRKNGLKTKMILQVHDELVFELPKEECERAKKLIQEAMQNAVILAVPLEVSIGTGNNWLQAH